MQTTRTERRLGWGGRRSEGFEDEAIRAAYEAAMASGLYDAVAGIPQGCHPPPHPPKKMRKKRRKRRPRTEEGKVRGTDCGEEGSTAGKSSSTGGGRSRRKAPRRRKLAKAYACTNHMEYFAEISTAFFGTRPATNPTTTTTTTAQATSAREGGSCTGTGSAAKGKEFKEEEVEEKGDDDGEEYNKWYPFNAAQLLRHDPASPGRARRLGATSTPPPP